MKKGPANVTVTIEQGHCSFCDRTRNLRREERHLGGLVRTVVTCESCHRTLTSSMGVPAAQAAEAAAEPVTAQPEPAEAVAPAASPAPAPNPVKAPVATKTRRPAGGTETGTKKAPGNG